MSKQRTGVYPGTFDPITNGHLDIILRAATVVDRLVLGIAANAGKGPMFTLEERCAMAERQVARLNGKGMCIEVRPFDNLLVQFAEDCGANILIRGLRAVSDFEYEFQMAGMNRRLKPDIETVFLMASERNQFISSRFVKEIGRLGGDISGFVPPDVLETLQLRWRDMD